MPHVLAWLSPFSFLSILKNIALVLCIIYVVVAVSYLLKHALGYLILEKSKNLNKKWRMIKMEHLFIGMRGTNGRKNRKKISLKSHEVSW
jgi:hypothetical protein